MLLKLSEATIERHINNSTHYNTEMVPSLI